MSEFKIANENVEDWEELEFLSLEHNVATYLVIDWNTEEATVEKMDVNNIHRGHYVCDSTSIFELDVDIDFSKFEKYYNKAIKPIVEFMNKEVMEQWTDKVNVLDIKHGAKNSRKISSWYNAIFNLLNASPSHNYYIAWTFDHIVDYYEEEGSLCNFLEVNGLDFRHVTLTEEICKHIITTLERDFVKVAMPFETFMRGLIIYQNLYK